MTAVLVALGKFDPADGIKLRAAYAEQSRPLATQPRLANGHDGIARALKAHAAVPRYAPTLIPILLAQARLRGGQPYLVETWLNGEPLATRLRLAEGAEGAEEILTGLAAVHAGFGVTPVRVSEHWTSLTEWSDWLSADS